MSPCRNRPNPAGLTAFPKPPSVPCPGSGADGHRRRVGSGHRRRRPVRAGADKRRDFPALAALLAGRLRAADPGAHLIRTTIDATLQAPLEHLAAASAAAAATGPATSVAILVADHRSGAILASVGAAAWADDARGGYRRHDAGAAIAGIDAETLRLRAGFRRGSGPSRNPDRGSPDRLRSLCATEFRRSVSRHDQPARSAATVAEHPGGAADRGARPGAADGDAAGGRGGTASAGGSAARTCGGTGRARDQPAGLVQAYAALARLGRPIGLSARPDEAGPLPGRLFSPEAAWLVADILAGLPPPPGART